jgi:hypothetical protein
MTQTQSTFYAKYYFSYDKAFLRKGMNLNLGFMLSKTDTNQN